MMTQDALLAEFGLSTAEVDALPVLSNETIGGYGEDLAAVAAAQPDDTLALRSLGRVLQEVGRRGDINNVIKLGAYLAALACQHSHMEGTAREATAALDRLQANEGHHRPAMGDPTTGNHDHASGVSLIQLFYTCQYVR